MPDSSPEHSQGYGPAEQADDTRQAQHTQANDTPTDVNMNAVLARAQAGTIARMGENFEANAARLNAIMSHLTGKLANS